MRDISKSGCWTFHPDREVWSARTGEHTWTEIKGALGDPPPTYQVTMAKPGEPVLVVAECPSGWHATQVATAMHGAATARGRVITIRRDDGKPA